MSGKDDKYKLPPLVRQDKKMIYKNEKYCIDFQLVVQNSNYFYEHQLRFEGKEEIELEREGNSITTESICTFIKTIQNEEFSINDRNIFALHQLSIKYDVPKLTEITRKYIKEHDLDLIFDIIKYKLSLFETKEEESENNFDTEEEEEKIATDFFKYIKRKELISLPVSVLYRIINKPQMKIENMNEEEEKKFIEFLFDCLKEHGRKGSILFSEIIIKTNQVEIMRRLIDEYSKISDFRVINPIFLFETTQSVLIEQSKSTQKIEELLIKLEEEHKIQNEMKEEINQLKNNEMKLKYLKEQLSKENEELIKSKEQLFKENEELIKSKEQLFKENVKLTKSKEQLSKENEELIKSKEQLFKENVKLTKSKEQFSNENEELTKSQEHLSKENKLTKYPNRCQFVEEFRDELKKEYSLEENEYETYFTTKFVLDQSIKNKVQKDYDIFVKIMNNYRIKITSKDNDKDKRLKAIIELTQLNKEEEDTFEEDLSDNLELIAKLAKSSDEKKPAPAPALEPQLEISTTANDNSSTQQQLAPINKKRRCDRQYDGRGGRGRGNHGRRATTGHRVPSLYLPGQAEQNNTENTQNNNNNNQSHQENHEGYRGGYPGGYQNQRPRGGNRGGRGGRQNQSYQQPNQE